MCLCNELHATGQSLVIESQYRNHTVRFNLPSKRHAAKIFHLQSIPSVQFNLDNPKSSSLQFHQNRFTSSVDVNVILPFVEIGILQVLHSTLAPVSAEA